jgi:hypothetical protein
MKYEFLLKKYEDATSSNSSLSSAFSKTLEDLKILSMPLNEIEKKLPRVFEGFILFNYCIQKV